MLGYTVFSVFMSEADRVFDCLDVGTAVTDHTDTVDSQQWCAAVFGIVYNLLETSESASYKQIADLGDPAFDDLPFKHLSCGIGQPFGQFKHDITDKAITDDHVNGTGKNIPA